MEFNVRVGKESDLPEVLALIRELAAFEKMPDEVINTVEMMKKDGFGTSPIFGFYVAESNGTIIGTAIYYMKYSTWKGKKLYLEDLIVTESARGTGIGKALFEQCLALAKERGCYSMLWQVLDWNEPAIEFYKKYKTEFTSEWIDCSLEIMKSNTI